MAIDKAEVLAELLFKRMCEVDSDITKSSYTLEGADDDDRPPTGDDYNLLWDAIQDVVEEVLGADAAEALFAEVCAAYIARAD